MLSFWQGFFCISACVVLMVGVIMIISVSLWYKNHVNGKITLNKDSKIGNIEIDHKLEPDEYITLEVVLEDDNR